MTLGQGSTVLGLETQFNLEPNVENTLSREIDGLHKVHAHVLW